GDPTTPRPPPQDSFASRPIGRSCRGRSRIELCCSRGDAAELREVAGQPRAPETLGDPRAELLNPLWTFVHRRAQDMPHFVFHAPGVPLRSLLQLLSDVRLQMPHDELSHADPPPLMISRYRLSHDRGSDGQPRVVRLTTRVESRRTHAV